MCVCIAEDIGLERQRSYFASRTYSSYRVESYTGAARIACRSLGKKQVSNSQNTDTTTTTTTNNNNNNSNTTL